MSMLNNKLKALAQMLGGAVAVSLIAGAASAQLAPRIEWRDPALWRDQELGYFMRQTIGDEDRDIIRYRFGWVHQQGNGNLRAELGLGVRNNDWNGDYPADGTLALSYFWRLGEGTGRVFSHGGTGRLMAASEETTAAEIGYAGALDWERAGVRLFAGGQYLSDDETFSTNEQTAIFAQAEGSYWATPNSAVRAAIGQDDETTLAGVGVTVGGEGWPVALTADYSVALNDFRGESQYDDVYVGFIWAGPDRFARESLRQREARLGRRLFHRPTQPN